MENYETMKSLGYGGFGKIKLLRDIYSNYLYAAKFASYMNARETNSEYRILQFFSQIYAPEMSPAVELFASFNHENSRVLLLRPYRFDFRGLYKAHVFDQIYLKQFVFVVHSLVRAVAQMHALGVVHRDLKSANVLLDDTGKSRIADFGLAKIELGHGCSDFSSVENALASLESCIGPYMTRTVCTLLYRSPEYLFAAYRVNGKRVGCPIKCSAKKQDLFSQGVIIAEILINHFFIILDDANEYVCEKELKKLYLYLYGKDILLMVQDCLEIDVSPYEFIIMQFEDYEKESVAKMLYYYPTDMEIYFRTLIALRFGPYCFGTSQKYLDELCAQCGALLSCIPSRRRSIYFCKIFKQDQYNIISALPENALDAGTAVCPYYSLYVTNLMDIGGSINFSGEFRCNALSLRNSEALRLGKQPFKSYRDHAHFEQLARQSFSGQAKLK